MTTWAEFEAAAPTLATRGRELLYRGDAGEALLATVRDDQPPRIHPVNVEIVDGHLYAFILGSAKRTDLEGDGRYALHTHQDPVAPSEFAVRGHATVVDSDAARATAAAQWSFDIDEGYTLFEFSISSALLGVRETADDWPPRYSSWRAP